MTAIVFLLTLCLSSIPVQAAPGGKTLSTGKGTLGFAVINDTLFNDQPGTTVPISFDFRINEKDHPKFGYGKMLIRKGYGPQDPQKFLLKSLKIDEFNCEVDPNTGIVAVFSGSGTFDDEIQQDKKIVTFSVTAVDGTPYGKPDSMELIINYINYPVEEFVYQCGAQTEDDKKIFNRM